MNKIEALHARAVAEARDTYVDPKTGYDVFTSAYLLRLGVCCGSGCRHCPYGYEKVELAGAELAAFDELPEGSRKRRPS